MEYKYDVFISYRHFPLDRRVAEKLHKKLEKYKIPKRLREKAGKKKLRRVFRDAEELSVGNDLAEEIEEQLKNSEFLIVICSPASKESRWVNREVQTFLKYHSISNVLPILIKGEPDEAFPNVLLESGELLAADIRAKKDNEVLKKLNQEFLKILSPILHCSFDELKQRQKRYQMQKWMIIISIAFTLTLSFSVFMMIQNRKINNAYEEVLKNESRYLVVQAEQLKAEGDYIAAIRSLMKALPSKEQNRPLVPEAQYKLTDYMNLYQNKSSIQKGFQSKGAMTVSGSLEQEILLDPTGRYILAHDNSQIYIWETEHLKLINTIKTENSIQDSIPNTNVTENNRLFFADDYTIYCYDYLKNKVIWRWNNPSSVNTVVFEPEQNYLWALTNNSVLTLNPDDGSIIKREVLNLEIDEQVDYNANFVLSPDGTICAFVTTNKNNTSFLNIYDHSLKKRNRISCKGQILKTFIYDHNTVFYTCSDEKTVLVCYGLKEDRILWNHTESKDCSTRIITSNQWDEIHKDSIIYCYGNTMKILGVKDGKEQYSSTFSNVIKQLFRGENILYVIESTGKAKYLDFASEKYDSISFFPKELLCCVKQKDSGTCYVMESDSKIVKYSYDKADQNFKKAGNRKDWFSNYVISYENGFINYDTLGDMVYYSDQDGSVQSISLALDEVSHILSIYETSKDSISFLCRKGDESQDPFFLKTIHLHSKKVSTEKLALKIDFHSDFDIKNRMIAIAEFQEKEGSCFITNIATGEEQKILFQASEGDLSSSNGKILLSPNAEKGIVIDENQLYLYVLDLHLQKKIMDIDLSDRTRNFLDNATAFGKEQEWIKWSESGNYFCVSNDTNVFIYDRKGNMVHSVPYDSKEENDFLIRYSFSPDDRYFYYYYDGQLYQYEIETGKITNTIELSIESPELNDISWIFDEENLALRCKEGIFFIHTERDNFGTLAYIPDGFFYDKERKQFYVEYFDSESEYNPISSIKQYTLDDILSLASKIVGDE